MGKTITRFAVPALITLAATASGLSASSAGAATVPAAATAHTASVHAAPNPNAGRSTAIRVSAAASARKAPASGLQCGWTPANNANASGYIHTNPFGSYYLYYGPDYGCGTKGGPVDDDSVIVHCGWQNYNTGVWWDYVYNQVWGYYGWIPDQEVTWYGSPDGC